MIFLNDDRQFVTTKENTNVTLTVYFNLSSITSILPKRCCNKSVQRMKSQGNPETRPRNFKVAQLLMRFKSVQKFVEIPKILAKSPKFGNKTICKALVALSI